jgi:hypothetical protein
MKDQNSFDWKDPFRFKDQLNEEEKLIAQSAAEFCSDRLAPRIIEMNLSTVLFLMNLGKWDFWEQQSKDTDAQA